MLNPNFAVYLGKEKEKGFAGFIAENNFFSVLEVNNDYSKEEGRELLKKISQTLLEETVDSLASFEGLISRLVKEANLPVDFSLACGYLMNDEIFYLKTIGLGEIYIKRGKNFAKLIEGDNSASGFLKENDFFIFSTYYFSQILGGEDQIKKCFDHKKPTDIVEELTPQMKARDDQGIVALMVLFEEQEESLVIEEETIEKPTVLSQIESVLKSMREKFTPLGNIEFSDKRRKFTSITVIIILIILIWSVLLGYKRRTEAEISKKIQTTKELISQKLAQADEVAFLNLPRALALISESKKDLFDLEKRVDKAHKKNIDEIKNLIQDKEAKLLKKEEKNFEEFFDLSVEEKEAKGEKLYLESDNGTILNREKGTIYSLSLSKKSLKKTNFNEIKSAKLVASYQNETLFYNGNDGIYKINEESKLKKVIEKDKDWGETVDMWVYNGNIYLLDKGKDEIYKYLVAETGYSAKNSYFKSGQAISLNGANSLAIDSSVYIGFKDKVVKYTAGLRDDFKTSFPDPNVNITKIFTSKNEEKVYAWDKDKGVIYIIAKNGNYERQVESSILTKTTDFVVYNKVAYLLAGQKIFKINLD